MVKNLYKVELFHDITCTFARIYGSNLCDIIAEIYKQLTVNLCEKIPSSLRLPTRFLKLSKEAYYQTFMMDLSSR